MDEKGYSFQTQEKLKDYCQKNRINLDLVEYRQTVDHDQILEKWLTIAHWEIMTILLHWHWKSVASFSQQSIDV